MSCFCANSTRPGPTNVMSDSKGERSDISGDVGGLFVNAGDVVEAAARLKGRVHRTSLLTSHALDDRVGAKVVSKAEHLQRSGSFKIRGAVNRLALMSREERRAGVVAFSSGNHAQGVALAASMLGVRALIVMPRDAPEVKLAATRGYGAEVVTYDRLNEDREAIAQVIAAQRGSVLVHPFDDRFVAAGQGTVGLESAQDRSDIEIAVVPIGGGGLCAGMCVALKASLGHVEIWGVEPVVADDARQSLAAGSIVRIPTPVTIADGVAASSVGSSTFPVMAQHLAGIVTVSEEEISDAMRFVFERMKQVVEPTGALTTAALLNGRIPLVKGRTVLSVFCGGNIDATALGRLLAPK